MVVVLLAALAWCLGALALDRYGRRALPPEARFDAIVVLGCRVGPGGVPSPALARRTLAAVQLFERGVAPRIVFTGGVGDHPPSEAEAAAALARRYGVPAHAILLEADSTSTEQNARFAAQLFERGAAGAGGSRLRVVLVSDAYHVFRAERVFAKYFDEVRGYGSINLVYPRVVGSLREVVAVLAYAALGRL